MDLSLANLNASQAHSAKLADLTARVEKLEAALERIIKLANDNGMQDWKMTKVAKKALAK